MKKNIISILYFFFCFIIIQGQNLNTNTRIIIKLKNYNSLNSRESISKKIDLVNKSFRSDEFSKMKLPPDVTSTYYIAKFPENTNIQQVIAAYYNTGEIEFAEIDYKANSDGQLLETANYNLSVTNPDQWALKNNGSFNFNGQLIPSVAGADIKMEDAWAIEEGKSSVIVAIVDSGAKLDHPGFENRIWINEKEIPQNGIDDDNNGYIDDIYGWNWVSRSNMTFDDRGHGTHVASIIGANDTNPSGYSGVDKNCKLMILKALDSSGEGYYSDITNAMYYAVNNGARVINLSLSGENYSIMFREAVEYAHQHNVVVVAATGNRNLPVMTYPAGIEGVIAVGSTDPDDKRSHPFFSGDEKGGSNYGSYISVVAPGNYICGFNYLSDTEFSFWGGTSQAVPHVVGVISLLIAQNPERTHTELKEIIENSADDQVGTGIEDVSGWDEYYGHGRINAFRALSVNPNLTLSTDPLFYSSEDIKVFPNPAQQVFNCQFPKGTQKIEIFNSSGQLLMNQEVTHTDSHSFHISQSGIYFIWFTLKNNQKITKKLIINQ